MRAEAPSLSMSPLSSPSESESISAPLNTMRGTQSSVLDSDTSAFLRLVAEVFSVRAPDAGELPGGESDAVEAATASPWHNHECMHTLGLAALLVRRGARQRGKHGRAAHTAVERDR